MQARELSARTDAHERDLFDRYLGGQRHVRPRRSPRRPEPLSDGRTRAVRATAAKDRARG
jgi:hypothetical protein